MLAEIFGLDGAIFVVVAIVVLFGGSQIPKLAHSLGSARKEFKKGLDEGDSEVVKIDTGSAVVKVEAEPKS